MKTTILIFVLALGLATSAFCYAANQSVDSCITAIQKNKTGAIIKLEKLNVAGKPFYEFEIKDGKNVEWEFMCNAKTGKITETESEVSSTENRSFQEKLESNRKTSHRHRA